MDNSSKYNAEWRKKEYTIPQRLKRGKKKKSKHTA